MRCDRENFYEIAYKKNKKELFRNYFVLLIKHNIITTLLYHLYKFKSNFIALFSFIII
jgi:hypothetical protein